MKAKDMVKIIQKHEREYYKTLKMFDREYNRLLNAGRLETTYGSFVKENALIYSRRWHAIYQLMKELGIESEEY